MSKMVKESKVRILENFYGIDYTLFGKTIKEVEVCCPFFKEEYISTKGALISTLIEIYKLVEHSPSSKKEIDKKVLHENAKRSASVARENSKILISSDEGKELIKKRIRESLVNSKDKKVNLESEVQKEFRSRAFSYALDSLLINRILKESKSLDKLKTWEGKVLKEAYRTLRNALIESTLTIMENKSE